VSLSEFPPKLGSAFDWRERAEGLFVQADSMSHPIKREALRRKATAALNIADAMEFNAQLAL